MDADEFRKRGREMIDYVANYFETIKDRPSVSAQVQPGYMQDLIPGEAPNDPEPWQAVFNDIERVIMPGVTHWQSPNFHAYFPAGNSYPVIIADILASVVGVSTQQMTSPADGDLEEKVMDWLAKMMNLPQHYHSGRNGNGVILGSASEATMIALLAAKNKMKKKMAANNSNAVDNTEATSKLVMYCSDEAHSSVEKAALLTLTRLHKVESDERSCLRGEALRAAIEEDLELGLVPFYCVASMGTTSCCSFDNLSEIGPICQKAGIWIHVDAAYAGASFICPEFQHLTQGLEFTDSFDFNPCKWFLTNYDISAMWLKNSTDVRNIYQQHLPSHQNEYATRQLPPAADMFDFWNLAIPVTRRFRALKLWFLCRLYGTTGLQKHIRHHVSLAKEFEDLVRRDTDFEISREVTHGLVCFRLKVDNEANQKLLRYINSEGLIHIVPAQSKHIFFLRFAISTETSASEDIQFAWKVIRQNATKVLTECDTMNGHAPVEI